MTWWVRHLGAAIAPQSVEQVVGKSLSDAIKAGIAPNDADFRIQVDKNKMAKITLSGMSDEESAQVMKNHVEPALDAFLKNAGQI